MNWLREISSVLFLAALLSVSAIAISLMFDHVKLNSEVTKMRAEMKRKDRAIEVLETLCQMPAGARE